MANPFKRRLTASDIPGFAGGTLEDLLAQQQQDPQPQGVQVLTPQNQTAITRPRTVEQVEGKDSMPEAAGKGYLPSFKARLMEAPPVQNDSFGSSGEPFSPSRPRRTQPRDFVADDAQALRDLENQPRTWRDKAVEVARAVNVGLNGPQQYQVPTKRERNLAEAQSRLSRDSALASQRSLADAREAQILSGQERVRQGDERIKQGDERLTQGGDRIKQQQRQTLASVLNRMDEFDPDDPANLEMVNALRANQMPVVRKKRGQQLKFVQNASTGEWEVIAGDKTTGAATSSNVTTPAGEQLVTTSEQEMGREQNQSQFDKRMKFQKEMKSLDRAAAEKRARIMVEARGLQLGDPDEYGTMADKLDDEADAAAADKTRTGKETAARLRVLSNQNRVLASKARQAQSGGSAPAAAQPKRKWSPTPAFREGFKKRYGRAPTQADIDAYAAAANQ